MQKRLEENILKRLPLTITEWWVIFYFFFESVYIFTFLLMNTYDFKLEENFYFKQTKFVLGLQWF